MVISETTVRPMDGAVEHPRKDLLRVVEQIPWFALQYLTPFYPFTFVYYRGHRLAMLDTSDKTNSQRAIEVSVLNLNPLCDILLFPITLRFARLITAGLAWADSAAGANQAGIVFYSAFNPVDIQYLSNAD